MPRDNAYVEIAESRDRDARSYRIPTDFIYQFANEQAARPMPATPRPTPARNERPTPPVWNLDHVRAALETQGYGEWLPEFIVPGPYPFDEVGFAAGIQRTMFSDRPEHRVGCFVLKFNNRTREWWLEMFQLQSYNEYRNYLNRARKDIAPFNRAEAQSRRRAAARLLQGDVPALQLLLPSIVDDDEIRLQLRGPAHEPLATAKGKADAARDRMDRYRQDRSRIAQSGAPDITLTPETPRGQRAMMAADRRRSQRPRAIRGN